MLKNKKIKVMLADFLYDNDKGPSYNLVPLNIGYLVSYANRHYGDKFDFKLYRNIDKFIKDFNNEPPSIVAFSQYIWNDDLTQGILKWIKSEYPKILSISGGPMVGITTESIGIFFKTNPSVDLCIPGYGEYGFTQVLSRYIETKGNIELIKNSSINGVAFLLDGKLVNTEAEQLLVKPNIDMEKEITSPYLTGLFDEFLKDSYSPMVQGMRGCPFKCTFCFASKLKIAKFSEKHVLDELDYIYKKTKSSALVFTDDNFGMYRRDQNIAKKIRELYDESGIPSKIYMYYSKKPTETVMEASKIMGDLTPFFISYQSRNEKTLDSIERYNLEDENTKLIIKTCKENSIPVTSEMIFGLPYETKDSFMTGVEELYNLDVDTIAIYHAKYFNGTELSTKKSRDEVGVVTMHRFYEDNFQLIKTNTIYGDILACETDEVPVSSSSYSLDDFLEIRMLGFWIELFFAKKIYYDILKHIESYGISPFDFIQKLIDGNNSPDSIKLFFNKVRSEYKEELYETHSDLKSAYRDIIKNNPKYKSIKINLYYSYILIYTDIKNDLDFFMENTLYDIAKEALSKSQYNDFISPLKELFKYNSFSTLSIDSFYKNVRKYGKGNNLSFDQILDLNQESDNAQRYLLEGTKSSKIKSDVSTNNEFLVNSIAMFSYDFPAWKADNYKKKINKFKTNDSIELKFFPINSKQYEVFVNNVDKSMRPFVWHNYITSSNVLLDSKML